MPEVTPTGLWLSETTAFLSAFIDNLSVVSMMTAICTAPAKKVDSSPFAHLIAIAVSSDAVTTVNTIADPPSIIPASETGMKILDFY